MQFGQSIAEGASRHSSGAHPHSLQRTFNWLVDWRLSLTPLLGGENDYHQDDQRNHEQPSEDGPRNEDPEEGDDNYPNYPIDVLQSDQGRSEVSG